MVRAALQGAEASDSGIPPIPGARWNGGDPDALYLTGQEEPMGAMEECQAAPTAAQGKIPVNAFSTREVNTMEAICLPVHREVGLDLTIYVNKLYNT